MKMYINDHSLRIVGKSWEVRAKLKELSRSSLTVQQYIHFCKTKDKKSASLKVISS